MSSSSTLPEANTFQAEGLETTAGTPHSSETHELNHSSTRNLKSKFIRNEESNFVHNPTHSAVKYLESSLGNVLANCMVELSLLMPDDPIDFMARWLYRYVDFVIYTQEKANFLRRAAAVAAELANEKKLRRERMLKMLQHFQKVKENLLNVSPSAFKALFSGKGKYKKGQEIDDAYLERFLASSSSSKRSLPEGFGTLLTTKPGKAGRRTSSRSFGTDLGRGGKKGGSELSDDSGTRYKQRKGRRSDDDDESDEWEEGEGGEGSYDSQGRPRIVGIREDHGKDGYRKYLLSAKDSLVSSKKLPTRDSSKSCYWMYEYPPGVIVCVHPLLGKLRAKKATIRPEDQIESWYTEESPCQSLYNHELYVCLPEELLYETPAHEDSEKESGSEEESQKERSDKDQSDAMESGTHRNDTSSDSSKKRLGAQENLRGSLIENAKSTQAYDDENKEAIPSETEDYFDYNAEAECTEPKEHAECTKPKEHAECTESKEHAECTESKEHAECTEPKEHAECTESKEHAECTEPTEHAECTEPTEHAECTEPKEHAECTQKDDANDDNGEDDVRWQPCEGEEVCEGWRLCEGFHPDSQYDEGEKTKKEQ